MLTISVEFLFGTFRADPQGTAHTGGLEKGEWPPSPARLFSALVAADGTDVASTDRQRRTTGSELLVLERLGAPTIYADPNPSHQVLQHRFVASSRMTKSQHHEYMARTGVLVRPGVRVSCRCPHVYFLWDSYVNEETTTALRHRAARVGYLGCSDSPVRVRVSNKLPSILESQSKFKPDDDGDIQIGVPRQGYIQALDSMYSDWVERGPSVGRYQYPILNHRKRYRSPMKQKSSDHGRVVAWLQLKTPVPGRRISEVSALFKAAVQSHHKRIYGKESPKILHGHGFERQGYELARFLALPDVGHKYSRGRIHGLALWLPPGVDRQFEHQIRDAAKSIRRLVAKRINVQRDTGKPDKSTKHLVGKGINVRVAIVSGRRNSRNNVPWAATPERWKGQLKLKKPAERWVLEPAKRWVTATPAIHERYGPLNLSEISRWCDHAGLPEPIQYRSSRSPLLRGGLKLSMTEVTRPGRLSRPFSHVEIYFDKPIYGPVVIGAGRQRGFGLCVPVDDKQDSMTDHDEADDTSKEGKNAQNH